MSRTRHGIVSTTFRRRILRGGYIAWRILRIGTLEGPAGWSFDPSAEGAMTTLRFFFFFWQRYLQLGHTFLPVRYARLARRGNAPQQ